MTICDLSLTLMKCCSSIKPLKRRHSVFIYLSYTTVGALEPQSRQSAKLCLKSSELGLPQPLPLVWGGGAHSLARRGVEESQFRRGELHCGTLYMCVLSDWNIFILSVSFKT